MIVYLVGWEDQVKVFDNPEAAVRYHQALGGDLKLNTWEEVLEEVNHINEEGNYHKYRAEVHDVLSYWIR